MQKRLMDYSAFDIIGPRMIGPSSSHTGGGGALAQVAGKIAGRMWRRWNLSSMAASPRRAGEHGTDRGAFGGDPWPGPG